MNEKKKDSALEATKCDFITLIDGRELPVILKTEQPSELFNDELSLDTTGQYFSIHTPPRGVNGSDLVRAERQYNHYLFTENAWLLLDHSEEIFSDSRMFLAPVKVQNGLAYTGTSGFSKPTIGVYLEWWLNFKEAAIDNNGNLVWYISGSPLSGCNCCSSVTPEGEQVDIAQRTKFRDIWGSFMTVNNRYTEAKQRGVAFSLEEVILKLRGEGYKMRILELKHEMIQKVMHWNYEKLQESYDSVCTRLSKLLKVNKKMQLDACKERVLEFAKSYLEKEEQYKALHELFVKKRRELRQQLHAGLIKGDYNAILGEAARESRALKNELSDMGRNFMYTTFRKNPNEISLRDVLKYAKVRLEQ